MKQNYIGTEHLLMGILREGESIAVKILMDLGVDTHKLYDSLSQCCRRIPPPLLLLESQKPKRWKRLPLIHSAEIDSYGQGRQNRSCHRQR